MIDQKSAHKLELPKILHHLAQHTSFSAGRELALALTPSTDPEEVERRLCLTSETIAVLAEHENLTVGGARDVRPLVEQAHKQALLQTTNFLDIRQTLQAGVRLKRLIARLQDEAPTLARVADRIEPCTALREAIDDAIDETDGEVRDSASPKLRQLRRDVTLAHDRLMDKLQRIVSATQNQRYLQEPIITQRAGRYVIPVKVEHKGRIQGVVHDQSSSGATVFVEPLATLDLNNKWRELQLAEQHEVERILRELGALVAENGDEILWTVETLAELDLQFAKARYALELDANEPTLSAPLDYDGRQPYLELLEARHPLLDPETVGPIDVWLGPDFRALVITGPNTGGKTVTLKTIGLFALMTMCGLHIPAHEESRVPVFNDVFADIGDEQSIEQSLSTFSSHMTNIIRIIEAADAGSLVLLDEIGAGTDPVEGAALARALLMHFVERDISIVVATHYSELKIWAHKTDNVQNASVEFDVDTLKPTYHLRIGLPGRSNALAIARRLGLPTAITERARSMLSDETLELEALLTDMEASREEAEREAERAHEVRAEAERLRSELEERLANIEHERIQLLNEAREEGRAELEAVRATLREVMRRLARYGERREELTAIRDELQTIEEEQLAPLRAVAPKRRQHPDEEVPQRPIRIGDQVWVATLGKTGQVMELTDDKAEVQAGAFRVRADVGDLELRTEDADGTAPAPQTTVTAPKVESPGRELGLRGLTVDEALPVLDKYLDDAYLAGLDQVQIIHGKGTGTLRRVVRDELRDHPLVQSYRSGDQYEGGSGVTVVRLARK